MAVFVPRRGDLIWLDFNPQTGHEQAGRRPAFVVSPLEYNRKTGLAVCCPVTSQIKGYPFEVVLQEGFRTQGAILSDQLKSLDWRSRKARFIERAPDDIVAEVIGKLGVLLK